jgi:SAM-dependent methyltransferase
VSSVFDAYAAYYDALYAAKDYRAEADYVAAMLRRHAPPPTRLLDVGSGTGRHALELASLGYSVTGIDASERMVSIARERAKEAPSGQQPTYAVADARSFRLDVRFGAVTSLFHVVSYLTEPEHLQQAFSSVHAHLEPGGVFFFDYWHSPGVQSDPPTRRERSFEHEGLLVKRQSTPVWSGQHPVIEVNFDVEVSGRGHADRFSERHVMRHYHPRELHEVLARCGFELLEDFGWMKDIPPDDRDWYACTLALKTR